MAKNATYVVRFRRRKSGKTNYRKRINMLKSDTPRFVVRKTNKHIICMLVTSKDAQDKILVQVNSQELLKQGWKGGLKNIPAAYLTGYLCGKKIGKKKAILDAGTYTTTKGSKIYAALKGAIDAGVNIPYSEGNLPSEDRIKGKHIKAEEMFEKVKKKMVIK